MQLPPLLSNDLIIFVVVAAISLLIAAEILSPCYGITNLPINHKKMRRVALVMAVLLIAMAIYRLVNFVLV